MKLVQILQATEHAKDDRCLKAICEALDGIDDTISAKCEALRIAREIAISFSNAEEFANHPGRRP
jgi:hypothetical protein